MNGLNDEGRVSDAPRNGDHNVENVSAAFLKLQAAALDLAAVHVQESLERVVSEGQLRQKFVIRSGMAFFIAVGVYGVVFDAFRILAINKWPSLDDAGANLVSHCAIVVLFSFFLFSRRLLQFGRVVSDATH